MTGMKNRFVLTYVLLVIAQMLLCNYFHFTPYIMLTILPIMVFCIPTRVSVFWTLIIAFVTGLAVDYFAEGIIGLNAAALLPVAILRRTLIEAIFGPEPFEQEEIEHQFHDSHAKQVTVGHEFRHYEHSHHQCHYGNQRGDGIEREERHEGL